MSIEGLLRASMLIFFFYTFSTIAVAQQNIYDSDLLPSSFHKERRDVLRSKLPEKSAVVIFSNPIRNRSNDVDYMFSQDPDLYYLSGLMEPNSVLIILSDSAKFLNVSSNEFLFIQARDIKRELWDGPRIGVEGAQKILGIKTTFENKKHKDFYDVLSRQEHLYIKFPTDIDPDAGSSTSLNRMVRQTKSWINEWGMSTGRGKLSLWLADMREVKTEEELLLMRKAIDITCEGLEHAIRETKPGMTEYQAQAVAEYHYRYQGSEYQGYGSICGSGPNTCTLHYVDNRRPMEDGDLLLMDIGAEYHGYTADVTRTIPVNGKFSKEQKAIYDIVLEAQEAGIQQVRSGVKFSATHKVCQEIIGKGLVRLGIIDKPSEYRKYFMHGTSHYLGLEVHDSGLQGKLRPGNVITVEPGIYIKEASPCDPKWWGIGIRIEDDVLVTEGDPEVLSGSLTKTVKGIEDLMRSEAK